MSKKKQEFLNAANRVIDDLKDFWPLSVRQIHYGLLNNPPLTSNPKSSKHPPEHYRYKNDKSCYGRLVELLRQGRYSGQVSMIAIDDPTRPHFHRQGWNNVSHFVDQATKNFLVGYRRDKQRDQPRHIEVLGEKNTLIQIMKPVCADYDVPMTLARGYGSIPIWRDMSSRFKNSGKDRMSLIVVSDFDPEGMDLADDAIRTLRDIWGVDVQYCRVGVTREQIEALGLQADFNPAKDSSSRFNSFVERTGSTETWEVEALPPNYLQDELRSAILANMDQEILDENLRQQQQDVSELLEFRNEIAGDLT